MLPYKIVIVMPPVYCDDFATWENNQYGPNFVVPYFGSGLYEFGTGPELYRAQSPSVTGDQFKGIAEHVFDVFSLSAPSGWEEMTPNQRVYAIKDKQTDFLNVGIALEAKDINDPSSNYNFWEDVAWLLNENLTWLEE